MRPVLRLFFILLIFIVEASSLFSVQNEKQQILVLNSFFKGLKWSDKEMYGIESFFNEKKFQGNIFIEYLGFTFIEPTEDYYSILADFFEKKYKQKKIDLIISTDDYALIFLVKYYNKLFPGIPIVFCGVSKSKENLIPKNNDFMGIYDEIDLKKNLSLASSLFPETKNFIFINARTTIYENYTEKLKILEPEFSKIQFHYLTDLNKDSLIKKINNYDSRSIVFPISYGQDTSVFMPFELATESISKRISIPMMSFWDDVLNHGVLGGHMLSGEQQGRYAAELAYNILTSNNHNYPDVSDEIQSTLFFDYNYLARFDLNISALPFGANIINIPESFYQRHKEIILPVIFILFVFLLLIILLYLNILKRKRIENELIQNQKKLNLSCVSLETALNELKTSREINMHQERLRSLGQLAGGIAHDFNNILSIILGHASLLERRIPDDANIKKKVDAITKATKRGASLVKQLLTFARKNEPVLESVLVNGIIEEIAKLMQETFPKTINIKVYVDDSPSIIADATQIHQIILNLCVNARDAMLSGGDLIISAGVTRGDRIRAKFPIAIEDEYLKIVVSDTGIGMDEITMQRIYEPFFTTKEKGKGTGLGLALVFSIVENHNGFIDVESSIGKGTVFSIYLPIPKKTAGVLITSPETYENILKGSGTILIVEDEELLREFVKEVLESNGYDVICAVDGLSGLQLFSSNKERIKAVISDIGLPKLSGDDLFKRISAINPNTPVVLASGFFDPSVKLNLYESGAKHFIQKPYSVNEILKKMNEIVN